MGYVHCEQDMAHIYDGTDYRCECGIILEIHDDGLLVVDGATGALLPDDSIKVTPPHSERKAKRLLSLNQKGRLYAEALENGFKQTAQLHDIPQGTLRKWGREYAALADC